MYWGGLRGAIAIAIVLSLPDFPLKETFVTLTIGAVLFTLIVQGLSMERLVRFLKLDVPPFTDRYAEKEGAIICREKSLEDLSAIEAGGLFSDNVVRRIRGNLEEELHDCREDLQSFRAAELDQNDEQSILFLRAFAEEQSMYNELFDLGHLHETTYRSLTLILVLQIDSIRFSGEYRPIGAKLTYRKQLAHMVETVLEQLPGGKVPAERLRLMRITRDYELDWAHLRGSEHVLALIDTISADEHVSAEVVETVREQYSFWHRIAQENLDQTAAQFPEFVAIMQERLGERLVLHAQVLAVKKLESKGALPHSVAARMAESTMSALRALRGAEWKALIIKPSELLRKVPCFKELSLEDFSTLERLLSPHSVAETETIIEQGEEGDELFLIARGVVRVLRTDDGKSRTLATLMAGDFFGEMALLHDSIRTATVKAITPCSLYVLKRGDIDTNMPGYERIMAALQEADERRHREQLEQKG